MNCVGMPKVARATGILKIAQRIPCKGIIVKRGFAARVDVNTRKTTNVNAGTTANGKIKENNKFFQISEEVRHAVSSRQAVVALESTIYTHGSWPYPENLQMALDLEARVRAHGAVPATIAVVDGVAHVGLTRPLLEQLLEPQTSQGGQALRPPRKLSRRDLASILGRSPRVGARGGTTIAGTMILAHLAGIKVFATGGLGGVHRGAEASMDISADLTELGRTPVAVISSGCKGFLDIPRTLEYLETEGVVVATFADGREGPAVDFPAFWSRDSGIKSPGILTDEKEAAAVIHAQSELSMTSGLLFANPVSSSEEISLPEISSVIDQALAAAGRGGVTGSENTPFVLNKIREITNGRSITTNLALVEGNVTRGSKVAVELSKLESSSTHIHQPIFPQAITTQTPSFSSSQGFGTVTPDISSSTVAHTTPTTTTTTSSSPSGNRGPADVVVAGAVAMDLSCNYLPPKSTRAPALDDIIPKPQTSNPSIITHSIGGVAHNIARTLHLLESNVLLSSAVANDLAGKTVLEALKNSGLDTSAITIRDISEPGGARTAQYVAVNDAQRNLHLAMSDMDIFAQPSNDLIPKDLLIRHELSEGGGAKWLILDANWSAEALAAWLALARQTSSSSSSSSNNIQTAYEPVSTAKSTRLFDTLVSTAPNQPSSSSSSSSTMQLVDLATPNSFELSAMHAHASAIGLFERKEWWTHIDALGIPSSGARAELVQLTSPSIVDTGIPQQSIQLLPFIPTILTKLGAQGVLLTRLLRKNDATLRSAAAAPYILSRTKIDLDGVDVGGLYMRLFPAVTALAEDDIVSVNGAGDTFLGALIAALNAHPALEIQDVVDFAQHASILTLRSPESVHPDLGVLLRPKLLELVRARN